ncbi:putative phage abortive infection protein, partial [Proteus mirabilis]
MNLKLCTNIFLTVFVILAVSALIVCWNDITVKEVWSNYISKPDPWVGIFTSIGAIFTVFVFIVTAYASLKSGESAKIAAKALELSRESSRRDDFIKQFTLLLEQHNRSHDALAKSIDSNNGQLISNSSSFIQWGMTLKEASKKLFQHYQYSPYMRILYRNLKYINESFYLESDDNKYIEEKKQYTAILRSIIRNDILFFVAINAKNEMKIFRRYEEILKNFSFFEHIIIDDIGTKIKFNIEEKKNVFSLNVKKLFEFYLNDYLNKTVYVRTTLEDKSIINEGVVLE